MFEYEPSLEKTKGKNVEINFIFARHSEKESAEIYDKEGNIAESSLSSYGKILAQEFGKNLRREGINVVGGYATNIARTAETLREIFKTAEPIDEILRRYLSFPVELPEEIEKKFQEIFEQKKRQLIKNKYSGTEFNDLSSTEQEEIVWQASEPALEWIIGLDGKWPVANPDSVGYQMAAVVAYKLNRFFNLPEWLKDDTKLNLPPSIGHKTQTEPFLVYCLKGLKGKDLIGRLREIGGGLHVMEGWRIKIKTDETGEKDISLFFRDKEYKIDIDKLKELAVEGRKILREEERKIDKT